MAPNTISITRLFFTAVSINTVSGRENVPSNDVAVVMTALNLNMADWWEATGELPVARIEGPDSGSGGRGGFPSKMAQAITGEFKPHRPEDAWAVKREDGTWLLDGFIPIPELKDRLGLKEVPEEEKGRYNTLSGMMMLLAGRLPQATDRCEWEGWIFEIMDMDGKRIDKVLATQKTPVAENPSILA